MSKSLLFFLVAVSPLALASESGQQVSPYAGQEQREIKSLSEEDIRELRRGGGWGLAKSAELNGLPGPAHLLELKDEIPLSANQVSTITNVFERMRSMAKEKGERLIDLERILEMELRGTTVTPDALQAMLTQIGQTRADLRYIHISAHLAMKEILTTEQIVRYNQLRGYGLDDPCATVPEGHDPDMWREHNNCE